MKRARAAASSTAKRTRDVASLIRECAARASFDDFFIYTDGSDLKHAAERRKGGSVVVVREKKVGTRGFSYDADSVIKDLSLIEKWARNASFSNPTAEILAATAALDDLAGADPVVETIAGGMRVSDYLPTRTFELTVHCLDIARATGLDFAPPHDALVEALDVAAESALELGMGIDVLLTLTGRQPLPPNCSVVP